MGLEDTARPLYGFLPWPEHVHFVVPFVLSGFVHHLTGSFPAVAFTGCTDAATKPEVKEKEPSGGLVWSVWTLFLRGGGCLGPAGAAHVLF